MLIDDVLDPELEGGNRIIRAHDGERTGKPLRKIPADIGRRNKIQLAIAHTFPLHHPAVIGPLQQSLSLARTAKRIARLAIPTDLAAVPGKCPPALDLPPIVGMTAPPEIAAIPLKPAARIRSEEHKSELQSLMR